MQISYARIGTLPLTNQIVKEELQQQISMAIRDNSILDKDAIRDINIFTNDFSTDYNEVSVNNKVSKKKATSLVYREIKQLLPDITDANLRRINSQGLEK
ncbi:hypothetical protein Glove_166g235 [Diversispora epigaea]|uniref:Uncharacterized protein n=1 Tax=Diversispora epigaea TaxID=1348612 RepID=A0A397IQV6_9GLOM|nr:hypothetical protein Glove_166g235 [Diversispora epigaea]